MPGRDFEGVEPELPFVVGLDAIEVRFVISRDVVVPASMSARSWPIVFRRRRIHSRR